jgi:hypothetical protein
VASGCEPLLSGTASFRQHVAARISGRRSEREEAATRTRYPPPTARVALHAWCLGPDFGTREDWPSELRKALGPRTVYCCVPWKCPPSNLQIVPSPTRDRLTGRVSKTMDLGAVAGRSRTSGWRSGSGGAPARGRDLSRWTTPYVVDQCCTGIFQRRAANRRLEVTLPSERSFRRRLSAVKHVGRVRRDCGFVDPDRGWTALGEFERGCEACAYGRGPQL